MSKSNIRKSSHASPNSSQMAALRRSIEIGDEEDARSRLSTLRRSFPDFKPLLALAWEIEDQFGAPVIATARAWDWLTASPNSRSALEAVSDSAVSAGLLSISVRVRHRLQTLDGEVTKPLPESFPSPLGELSFDHSHAIDLSRVFLADDNPASTIEVLRDVDHPSARNNHALALFCLGEVAQAYAMVDANWQAAPANLYALESALRWRCWLEGMDRCLGFKAHVELTTPQRSQDAIAKVLALQFLGDDSAARRAWEQASDASYWVDSDPEQRRVFDQLLMRIDALSGNESMWFPTQWFKKLVANAGGGGRSANKHGEQQWDAVALSCPAHVDYLARAVVMGSELTRMLAISVLKVRAQQQSDQAALNTLTALLRQPQGSDSSRNGLLNWLVENGLRSREEPAEVWLNGSLRSVLARGFTITTEPRPSPYSPQGSELNVRVHQAIGSGRLLLALKLAKELLQLYPSEPSALTNVAAIKEGLGHSAAEIMALYQEAHALAPDYLFARCGLARHLLLAKQQPEATKLMEGILDRSTYHVSEYRAILLAQQEFARANGDAAAVKGFDQAIRDLQKEFA